MDRLILLGLPLPIPALFFLLLWSLIFFLSSDSSGEL